MGKMVVLPSGIGFETDFDDSVQLGFFTPITMVNYTYNYSFHGYKPTNITGGPTLQVIEWDFTKKNGDQLVIEWDLMGLSRDLINQKW